MKSEAAEGIRRLRCFWPTALRDCELAAHEGAGGRGAVGNGCDAADGRKKSLLARTS